jgi:hypothetical protein
VRTIIGVFVIAGLVVGCGGTSASPVPSASVAPSSGGTFGGTVTFQVDGAPATTVVDGVGDASGASGTAVTTFGSGRHTVRVECAADDDGGWLLAGTVVETTVPGESAGAWSAVIVRDGSPPQIGIWLSADAEAGATCEDFASSVEPATIDASNFSPIESGELVPPA